MRSGKLSLLGVALATAVLATACNRADETAGTAYENDPAATTTPPASDTTTPATAAEGTNTAATDTTSATGTEPTATSPTSTASPTTTADAATAFDDMDINNDGSIAQDELPDTHPLRQGFTAADTDGNGTLSRSEVDAHRGTMPAPGG